ncbi:MAG: hypothetical protein RSA49_01850 [Anaerovoracaceae bacterium]
MKIGVLLAPEIEEDGIGYYDRKIFELLKNTNFDETNEVVGITVGKSSDDAPICEGLARGLDRGVLLVDNNYENSNCYSVSNSIASYISKVEKFDLIICGYKSHSSGSSMVPVLISNCLNYVTALDVISIDVTNYPNILFKSNHHGIIETIRTKVPTIICCENHKANINPVGLKDIMMAFDMEVKKVHLDTFNSVKTEENNYPIGKLIGTFKINQKRKNTIFDQAGMREFGKEIKELIIKTARS